MVKVAPEDLFTGHSFRKGANKLTALEGKMHQDTNGKKSSLLGSMIKF